MSVRRFSANSPAHSSLTAEQLSTRAVDARAASLIGCEPVELIVFAFVNPSHFKRRFQRRLPLTPLKLSGSHVLPFFPFPPPHLFFLL